MTDFRYMDRVRAREGAPPPRALIETERSALPVPQPSPRSSSSLARLVGGSPLGVFARLVFLSFLVGAALAWLDIRPVELLWWAQNLAHRLWAFGFDGLRDAFGYVLVGAMIVVPLWLLSRLFGGARA